MRSYLDSLVKVAGFPDNARVTCHAGFAYGWFQAMKALAPVRRGPLLVKGDTCPGGVYIYRCGLYLTHHMTFFSFSALAYLPSDTTQAST